jgi:hypothetical protein
MRKKLVLSVLAVLVLVGLVGALTGMATPMTGMGLAWTAPLSTGTATPATPAAPLNIASNVQAVYQGDASAGWDSQQQYQAWWSSACSVFALYEVLKAWGAETTPGKVLDQEIAAHAITEADGLISLEAYANLVPKDYAGLDTTYFNHLSLDHLQALTAAGYGVQVNLWDPDGRFYPFQPGHWLVVVGHSSQGYEVRDSSGLHLTLMSDQAFTYEFTHRAVVVQRTGEVLP